ncbi:hypothetical protein LEMLEM_LOCUS6900 [Lemmus lemmus]
MTDQMSPCCMLSWALQTIILSQLQDGKGFSSLHIMCIQMELAFQGTVYFDLPATTDCQ